MPRTFLALALPADARRALRACQDAVVDRSPAWRGEKWVPAQSLHLTLAFLGAIDDEALTRAIGCAERAASASPALTLSLPLVRAVPGPRAARMLWAVPERDDAALDALAASLHGELTAAGFALEERPFRAHVTLVRARRPRAIAPVALGAASRALAAAADGAAACVSVPGVTVFTSELSSAGAVHTARAFAPFARD